MDKMIYAISRLNGILEAFSYVNGKTNHCYSFEITILEKNNSIEATVEKYITKIYPDALISFEPLDNLQSELTQVLENWLFSYQPQSDNHGNILHGCGSPFAYLKDIDESFSMSDNDFRKDFIKNFIQSLNDATRINNAFKVQIDTDEWYECAWDDFALEGENAILFLHLGVSD